MNRAMIMWYIIAGVLLFAFALKTFIQYFTGIRAHGGTKTGRFIGISKDSEMFYVPGDAESDEFDD